MVVHFPSAAHDIAEPRIFISVAGTARYRILFIDMDPAALHLRIPDKIAGRCERCQPRAHDMGTFSFDSLWFQGMCECFIVSA